MQVNHTSCRNEVIRHERDFLDNQIHNLRGLITALDIVVYDLACVSIHDPQLSSLRDAISGLTAALDTAAKRNFNREDE